MSRDNLSSLQKRLGHTFKDASLLRQALTHRSYASTHYERLEFLGDSILNCVVADCLYQRFNVLKEGDLSRVRAHLVKQDALETIARDLQVSGCMYLGEGELKSGGLERPSILADVVEALFGAVFLDAGFDKAHSVIAKLYEPLLASIDPTNAGKDPKTQLQERLQAQKLAVPKYDITRIDGAAHEQVFTVSCAIPSLQIQTEGVGHTRRIAEQNAASVAMAQMDGASRTPLARKG